MVNFKVIEDWILVKPEESKNQKDDSLSLRFPVFVKLRDQDKEVSYH